MTVNRRDDRAHTSPAPLVSYDKLDHVPAWVLPAGLKRVLKRKQIDMFPREDDDVDGHKVRG